MVSSVEDEAFSANYRPDEDGDGECAVEDICEFGIRSGMKYF